MNPFPIENLPYGIFSTADDARPRVGVAIDDLILDVGKVHPAGKDESLNRLMGAGADVQAEVRGRVREHLERSREFTLPQAAATMHLPAVIGDYTDFYASIHHATNVGRLFRPDAPLMPNYTWLPIGYHGRASSVVVSGTEVRRPRGQSKMADEERPQFGETRALDYEVEIGIWIGGENRLGEPVAAGDADGRIFGYCLLNDWSARDVQSWEYQPLGPFLAKSFATSVSPWVVTAEAVRPFQFAAQTRAETLEYLQSSEPRGLAVRVETFLLTAKMRAEGMAAMRLSESNLRDLYWTPGQLVTHHASNGCNLRAGDLIGTGTISGESRESLGCLLEMTRRGTEPVTLTSGETRRYLEDGDEVIMRGWCEREGCVSIGFGGCRGRVAGARGV